MPLILSETELTELICTRLSHDLIGNIGAVSNAVEILEDDAESAGEIKPILETSAKTLTARLKFFRLAFGLDNACPKTIEELYKIAADYLQTIGSRTSPIKLALKISSTRLYKIILPALMALGDVFVRGGSLEVSEDKEGISFKAVSDYPLSETKLNATKEAMNGRINEENPSQVAAVVYLMKFLEDKKVHVKFEFEQNQAILMIN